MINGFVFFGYAFLSPLYPLRSCLSVSIEITAASAFHHLAVSYFLYLVVFLADPLGKIPVSFVFSFASCWISTACILRICAVFCGPSVSTIAEGGARAWWESTRTHGREDGGAAVHFMSSKLLFLCLFSTFIPKALLALFLSSKPFHPHGI